MEPHPQEDFARLRAALTGSLRKKGISDERVLAAIGAVPRERFVLPVSLPQAYADHALPFLEGQTVSQPFTVAFQTQLLQLRPGMTVLEIGTGSGYQAAVLVAMGASIFTIERIGSLYTHLAASGLDAFFPKVRFLHGDGYAGYPPAAPFQRILLTAAAPALPEALLKQLAPGGLLVAPIGPPGGTQVMMRFSKDEQGRIQEESFGAFSFVPLIRGAL